MASHSLEYSPVPSVSPSGLPDARARVQTSPESFGAGIGQAQAGMGRALEQAGAQAFDTAKFYSQVAADDGYNQLVEGATKILHGDPNAPTVGPDGSQQPNLGYMATKGADALNARKNVEAEIDKSISTIRSGLSPDAQRHFDQVSRRYRTSITERVAAHADNQAGAYYSSVNKAASDANLNAISLSPMDEGAVNIATNNLISARVKQAQLQGGGEEVVNEAVRGAKMDALKTRVLTISATDPVGAMKLLNENREMAGMTYQPLHDHLRTRADQQQGIGAANEVFAKTRQGSGYADPRLPIYTQATAAVPGSMSAPGLARLVKIESSGNPTAGAGRAHQGLVQASEKWWNQFGQGSRLDPEEAIKAAARATAHDRPILASGLGHDPTDAELYLAHQQGPGGALALLRHPDLPAADALVADGAYKSRAAAAAAIAGNGGDPNKPASVFTSMWTAKFGGGTMPVVTPAGGQPMQMPAAMSGDGVVNVEGIEALKPSLENPTLAPAAEQAPLTMTKAEAYREIMDRTDLSDQAKSYAISHFNQVYAAKQIADAADEKARHEASEKAANTVMEAIGAGQVGPDLVAQIYANPNMQWRTKHQLVSIAEHAAGIESTAAFGPGYADAFRRIVAPAGDPEKINDTASLLHMAGPGGSLTTTGYNRLKSVLQDSRRSVETAGVNTTKSALLNYAKQSLTFDQEMLFPGMKPLADPKGQMIFNAQFIPKFEAAYDDWIKQGKDPFQFLTNENVDKLAEGMRPKSQMALDKVAARGEAFPAGQAKESVPPPPSGVKEEDWREVVLSRPTLPNGNPWPIRNWTAYIEALRKDPSRENIAQFEAKYPGVDLDALLKRLGVETGDGGG